MTSHKIAAWSSGSATPSALDLVGVGVARGFRKIGVRESERACIAAKLRQPAEEFCIRRAPKECREQGVFLGASRIDFTDVAAPRRAVEVGTQHHALDAGCRFDVQDPLGRDPIPVGYGGLRYAQTPGKLANAASDANGLV